MKNDKGRYRLYIAGDDSTHSYFLGDATNLAGAIQGLINQSSMLRGYLSNGIVTSFESISVLDLHEFASSPYDEMTIILFTLNDDREQRVCIMKVHQFQ